MKPARAPALFQLTVPGQPAGAGSKTAQPIGKRFKEKRDGSGRLILIYRPSSAATTPWMERVQAFAAALPSVPYGIDGALWLDVSFYEKRPRKHFFQRKSGDVLRPDAPAYPHQTETHDVDKMRRAISDSLTGAGVLADDKRIVAGGAWKFYADESPYEACAVIRVGRMLHQTAEEAGIITPPPVDQESLA